MTGEKRPSIREIASQFCSLIRDNACFVVVAVCSAVFVVILEDVLELESMRLDRAAYWLIVQHLRRPWLTPVMESFSALATPVSMLVVLVVVARLCPRQEAGLVLCREPWPCGAHQSGAQVRHSAPEARWLSSCHSERL